MEMVKNPIQEVKKKLIKEYLEEALKLYNEYARECGYKEADSKEEVIVHALYYYKEYILKGRK